jgi:hypothetical protein
MTDFASRTTMEKKRYDDRETRGRGDSGTIAVFPAPHVSVVSPIQNCGKIPKIPV